MCCSLAIIPLVLFFFPLDGFCGKAPRVKISPKVIRQGDVFLIMVENAGSESSPRASLARLPIRFSGCGKGCFVGIGAVSHDAKVGAHMVRVSVGKYERRIRLTVKRGGFRTTSLLLPEEKVILSPEDLATVREENDLLRSLFLTTSDRLWEGRFLIPSDKAIVTPFGTKRIMNASWTSVHRGVDIRGAEGDEVMASNSGRVVLARSMFLGGNTIVIDHGQDIFTIYMHLSRMSAGVGDFVKKGDVIGLVGSTGRATGPHLHFGVKVSNISVNPLSLVGLPL